MSVLEVLRTVRSRLEGLFFLGAFLFTGIRLSGNRVRYMIRHGLEGQRMAWWPQFVMERRRDIWRYLLLIERYDSLNRQDARDEVMEEAPYRIPENGRIVIVKLGHFGDTLQMVPLLRGIKQARPDVTIDLVVGPWTADLAGRMPWVDRVIEYAPHMSNLHRGDRSKCLSIRGEVRLMSRLRASNYDLLICSYGTGLLEYVLISAVRPARWLGPRPDCSLYDDVGDPLVAEFERGLYEAERLARIVRHIGVRIDNHRLDYWISDEESETALKLLHDSGVAEAAYAIICPGAGWSGKRWPVERFAELADRMRVCLGLKIVICGSPSEVRLCRSLAECMKEEGLELAGKTGWGELAAIIRGAALFVGNDSGPMHLAAVYETPSVVLFGPTSDAQWAPRHQGATCLRKVESCDDCWSWHPGRDCVHKHRCIKQITVDEAWKSIQKIYPQIGIGDRG